MTKAMDKIFIKDLVVNCIIGVNQEERMQEQDVIINVILYVNIHDACRDDDLRKSVDYDRLASKIISVSKSAKRLTLEALANDIAVVCFLEPIVSKVKLSVEKPNAIKNAKSAGISITRVRKDIDLES